MKNMLSTIDQWLRRKYLRESLCNKEKIQQVAGRHLQTLLSTAGLDKKP